MNYFYFKLLANFYNIPGILNTVQRHFTYWKQCTESHNIYKGTKLFNAFYNCIYNSTFCNLGGKFSKAGSIFTFADFTVTYKNVAAIVFIFCDNKAKGFSYISGRLFFILKAHLRIWTKSALSTKLYFVATFNFGFYMTFYRDSTLPGIFEHAVICAATANFCCKAHFAANFAGKENLELVAFFYAYVALFILKFCNINYTFAFCAQVYKNGCICNCNNSSFKAVADIKSGH